MNEFVIKNGYLSRGDSEITGSLIISGSGSPLISLPDAPKNAAIISGSSGTTSVYIYDSVDGLRTPTYDKGAGLRLVSGEGTGQATLDVSAVGSDNGGSSNEQAFIRSNQMLSLYGEGNAAGDNIRLRGSSGYVALDSTTAGTSLTFVTNGGSTPSTIALGSFAGSAGVQITAPANNTYLRFIQGANTWLDLTSTKATFLADVSSSATSTASFGTYLGDGSQLTGIDTGSWDGQYSGSAEITGSLIVTGGITGSLLGTASTASYVDLVAGPNITINQVGTSFEISGSMADVFPYTGSAQITGSLEITGSLLLTSSYISVVDYIDFNNTGIPTPPDQEGRIYWDEDNGTLSLGMHGGQVVQQIGLEEYFYVKNQTGVTIPNGAVVRAAGTLGASGRILGDLMIADGSIPYYFALGVATEDIVDGDDGYVTQFGLVRGINTTGSNGETWNDGDILYASPTFSGSLTNIEPEAPNLRLQMAIVISAATNGSIFVRPDLGSDVGSLHDVIDTTTTASYGELFVKSGSVWTSTNQLTGSYAITGSLVISGSFNAFTLDADNIVLGPNAGTSMQAAADNNVVLGNSAASNLTTGDNNVIIGTNAGDGISTGGSNVVVGRNAGFSLVGNRSVLIGDQAGTDGGTDNVFVGYQAGAVGTGNYNVAIGMTALRGNSGGSNYNIAIGYEAGYSVGAGDENILVGTNAGRSILTGNANIIIGSGSLGASALEKQLRIGHADTIIISGSLITGDIIFPSTASATYFVGNGSQLTGIDTGSWDGQYSGSAVITGSLEVIGSQIISGTLKVHGGNVDITSNAYFFQGTNTSNGNVSLIGVNNQDQVYIGNQGYTNILADETHVRGNLQVTGSLLVTGSTNLNGSITTKTTRITASSYTASISDYRIAIRYTDTGSVSIQLPLISQVGQIEYKFKDEEGNAQINRITITASGSDLIDGDSNAILNRNYMAIGLYNDGVSNWYIE